ncbi:MAG: SDR family oxidoreductase [Wenzhouxiangellaceae bacterium]
MSRPPRLLIAGCGDLGIRLAARLQGWEVHGLRRRAADLPASVNPVAADLSDPASLAAAAGHWDAVVYSATPDAFEAGAYRRTYVDGLRNLLDRVTTDRLWFISSTAVYAQDQGEWVDEHSPTEPTRFNGRILLEAEQIARAAGGGCVRFSGIYGPGRTRLIDRLRSGPVACKLDPPQWTNRIHIEDCAAVLAHLLETAQMRSVHVASDPAPAPRWEVLSWLAGRLGVPGPVAAHDSDHGQGKRVRSRYLHETGYRFIYPDYRAGYTEIMKTCG